MNTDTMTPRHERPTPETDSISNEVHMSYGYLMTERLLKWGRLLEQQRDEAREINQQQAAQIVALREALEQYGRMDFYLFLLSPIGQQTDPCAKAQTALSTPPPPVVPLEDVRPLVEVLEDWLLLWKDISGNQTSRSFQEGFAVDNATRKNPRRLHRQTPTMNETEAFLKLQELLSLVDELKDSGHYEPEQIIQEVTDRLE